MDGIVFDASCLDPPLQPDKPPDAHHGFSLRTSEDAPLRLSFKDEIIGETNSSANGYRIDLIAQKLMTMDSEGGNHLLPKISLDKRCFKTCVSIGKILW